MRFLSALMPREARFFTLFNQHADLIAAGGRAAVDLVRGYDDTGAVRSSRPCGRGT